MKVDGFVTLVLHNRFNRAILERLPELDLADCWLVSGALFQTVWNVLSGQAPEHGIRDYDIFYFDPDTTWQSEDATIQRAAHLFEHLGVTVEVRNQARVHLWYEQKFAKPYPPLTRATDGIDRFLCVNAQVGMRRRGDHYDVYAPYGFEDIFDMRVRPHVTANFSADAYAAKAARWKSLWPSLVIDDA